MHAHVKILSMLRSGITPQVTFLPGCEDLEGYAEPGMKGRIIEAYECKDDNNCIKARVDFETYAEHNKTLESSTYFDDAGRPTLTARQAGQYVEIETIYFNKDGPAYFSIDSDARVKLFEQYVQEKYQGPYLAWLEDKLFETQEKCVNCDGTGALGLGASLCRVCEGTDRRAGLG